ncbi:unnamed protein product [Cyprideis torosa]|uniref:Uncharacterized protein n=1 Tax=Cyprideis torosa TaxID=163714 RepID=A0A7R8ZTK2_9CRUS|nr:unnamed protein product [Cyprideis torosa]CAG0904250.1 unnamed protein product [Cyprideis torosa]
MELILGVLLILGLLGKSLSVEYSRGIETCNDTRPFSWEDYFEVANGMNSALEFFAEDILNINLDGVLGVRMAEAALKHSIPQLETMRQEDPTNKKLRRALKRASVLHRKTQEIATNGVYQVQKTDPEYYRSEWTLLTNTGNELPRSLGGFHDESLWKVKILLCTSP